MADEKPRILQSVQTGDFAFTVLADALRWDVYHFKKDRKDATLAFTRCDNGQWEIGVLTVGHLDRRECSQRLMERHGDD